MKNNGVLSDWRKRAPLAAAAALAVLAIGLSPLSAAELSAEQIIAAAGKVDDNSFCGTKPMTLGVHDGFGANGWSKSSMAAVRSEAAKCPNVKQIVRIGQGDLQKSITDVNGLVSEGVDAVVLIPDFGKSQLPSIRAATQAGAKTVPWAADPGGAAGKDYVEYLDWDEHAAGMAWAEWTAKAINGEGNVVFLGGPAGNPVSAKALKGIEDAFKKYPKITLLTGYTDWPVTNWDAAQIQKTLTALLAKYPKIDAVINDSGGFESLGVLRAYAAANKPLVPLASLEGNQLACEYLKLKPTNPGLQLGTISGRNWIGRIAARKAIAAVQGIPDTEPAKYDLGIFEDTLGGKNPECDPALPPDALISARLTPKELDTYGKTE
jgi:ribose transport system substrate-binding protein